jgi:hypothetical protein
MAQAVAGLENPDTKFRELWKSRLLGVTTDTLNDVCDAALGYHDKARKFEEILGDDSEFAEAGLVKLAEAKDAGTLPEPSLVFMKKSVPRRTARDATVGCQNAAQIFRDTFRGQNA